MASGGSLKNEADFEMVLNRLEEGLGLNGSETCMCIFPRSSMAPRGSCATAFSRTRALALILPTSGHLVARGYAATIICESRGTMAEDAAEMLRRADAIKA